MFLYCMQVYIAKTVAKESEGFNKYGMQPKIVSQLSIWICKIGQNFGMLECKDDIFISSLQREVQKTEVRENLLEN